RWKVMPNPDRKKGGQIKHRVLPGECEAIGALAVRHHPFHEPFLLHLPESAGEDRRRQPGLLRRICPNFVSFRNAMSRRMSKVHLRPSHFTLSRIGSAWYARSG